MLCRVIESRPSRARLPSHTWFAIHQLHLVAYRWRGEDRRGNSSNLPYKHLPWPVVYYDETAFRYPRMSPPENDFEETRPDLIYPSGRPMRADFVESISAIQREDEAVARRREEALKHALRARGIPSDPDGKNFLAARARAIEARRAKNAQLELLAKANIAAAAAAPSGIRNPAAKLEPQQPSRWTVYAAAGLATCLLLSGTWFLGPLLAAKFARLISH